MMHKLLPTLLLTLCVAGCGSGGPPTAKVSGTVTLDGKPLPDIRVTFQPDNKSEELQGMGSYGLTDANGKFELKLSDTQSPGAVVGGHTVILADKLAEDPADSDAGAAPKVKSRVPAKLVKSPLHYDVQPGKANDAKFELTSK